MARPSKYNEDIHPLLAWSYALEGLTDQQIADKIGITRSTLNKWKKDYVEFAEALTEGKAPADAKVEKSLFQRATGYAYKEKKVIQNIDKEGNRTPAKVEITEKFVVPDTTACIFWLKNRNRNKWKDRQDVEVSNDSDFVFNILPASEKSNDGDDSK